MAEQHKENTPLDKKEKHSLLGNLFYLISRALHSYLLMEMLYLILPEEDIGKEFLASWKSMSVAGDDPMNFSFTTVGKSKKAFNFDKLVPEVEKVVPVCKYNDPRDVGSKFYQKPGATMPQSRLDSLVGEKHGNIISKGSSTRSIKLADETRWNYALLLTQVRNNDDISQSGRKLVSSLGLPSKELTKSHNEVLAIQKFCEKSKKVGTLRTKEDQLSSTAFKENLPIVNSEQKTYQKNSELEVARGTNSQKTPLINLSLKRTILEVANDDIPSFLPLKRLLESPKENRYFKVPSERIIMREIDDIEIHNTYASSQEETIQVTDSYQENQKKVLLTDNEARAEFSLTCETNSNVSKTKAYAKELEDICDLLRKKQEEAKELLVRALVNNNNLLLLNCPIYDGKIRAVQKVAAELMSKQLVI